MDGLTLSPRLWRHPRLWPVARKHGEDGDLDARVAQVLNRLTDGFYMPEKLLLSHPRLRPVLQESGADETRMRLDLLHRRGLIEIKRDASGRLYRLVPYKAA